jgi:hypothetical protein
VPPGPGRGSAGKTPLRGRLLGRLVNGGCAKDPHPAARQRGRGARQGRAAARQRRPERGGARRTGRGVVEGTGAGARGQGARQRGGLGGCCQGARQPGQWYSQGPALGGAARWGCNAVPRVDGVGAFGAANMGRRRRRRPVSGVSGVAACAWQRVRPRPAGAARRGTGQGRGSEAEPYREFARGARPGGGVVYQGTDRARRRRLAWGHGFGGERGRPSPSSPVPCQGFDWSV